MKNTAIQFLVFNLVGVANTIVGFSAVFLLLFMGIEPMLSNFLGYVIGAICSFFLNSKFTFKKYHVDKKVIIGFFIVLGIAYMINAIIFYFCMKVMNPYYAQVISGIVYTLTSFAMMKLFVFTKEIKI